MGIRALALALAAALALLALAAPASAGLDSEAASLLGDVVQGRDGVVIAKLDPQMHASLTAPGLAAAWAAYQSTFGRYLGHGSAQLVALGPITVVRIPLRMSHEPGEFRIAFQSDGRISGLYFLRTGVPL